MPHNKNIDLPDRELFLKLLAETTFVPREIFDWLKEHGITSARKIGTHNLDAAPKSYIVDLLAKPLAQKFMDSSHHPTIKVVKEDERQGIYEMELYALMFNLNDFHKLLQSVYNHSREHERKHIQKEHAGKAIEDLRLEYLAELLIQFMIDYRYIDPRGSHAKVFKRDLMEFLKRKLDRED